MKILISQSAPSNTAQYDALTAKFGVSFDFRPFFRIEPLSSREFRAEHINLADYTAVVFSSRHAIDAYFKLCEETRFKVPETMKYFCATELVAMYLQKHIVYRKRKIFFGDGTPQSIVSLIVPKHSGEKFLITASDAANAAPISTLLDKKGVDYSVAVLVQSVPQDLSGVNLAEYGMVVMYNPFDLKVFTTSFPDFKQGDLKIMAYGKGIAKALEEASFKIDVQGPAPEAPSVAKTLELYLSSL